MASLDAFSAAWIHPWRSILKWESSFEVEIFLGYNLIFIEKIKETDHECLVVYFIWNGQMGLASSSTKLQTIDAHGSKIRGKGLDLGNVFQKLWVGGPRCCEKFKGGQGGNTYIEFYEKFILKDVFSNSNEIID